MHVAIARGRERRSARIGVVTRPQATQRLEAHDRRVVCQRRREDAVQIGGRHLRRRSRGCDNRQSPDLRIGVVRGRGQRLRIDRARRRQRFERQPADARTRHRFASCQMRQPPRKRQRILAGSAQLPLGSGEAFETEHDAQAIGGAGLSSG